MVTKFEKSEVSLPEMLLRYTGNGEKKLFNWFSTNP